MPDSEFGEDGGSFYTGTINNTSGQHVQIYFEEDDVAYWFKKRTVAAAIEGAFFGITSIAVSLEYDEHADFDRAASIALDVITEILSRKPQAGSLYNINIPTRALHGQPELQVVQMSTARYGEAFEKRIDPRGRTYYWATNEPPPPPSPHDCDVTALAAGNVTLTPLDYDLTHRSRLAALATGEWAIRPRML